ncbi:MBOAT family O-acyltransferase [Luteolibacter soli]|uniref:MBOAT family O-acyltransferase n=1 Tax=Luteolibacter soli TaxID=3135280 RepID=A0ABU9ASX2_9BACT
MNFASYEFWRILLLCFLGSRLILALVAKIAPLKEPNASKWCLASTGLILLGVESWLTLVVFLWVVGLSWIGVVLAGRGWFNKPYGFAGGSVFVALLVAQLFPLFYYKYWDFIFNEWLGLGIRKPSVLIPMGLSFYTFQKIGFWIDTIRNPGKPPRFLDYLNFCSFFPQIVAGPIEKKQSLLPQIENVSFRIHRESLESALQWIVLGLAYKLIVADNLGGISQSFRVDPTNSWQVWFECLTFGIRIYFDFAGYSFIAVGLGLLLGVKLTLNFRSPYWAQDMREFWRNWHVTLGAWLRDYVYIPLGGRRVPWWPINTILVFVVSGIWHGAGWGFLMWGLLHGIGVVVCSIEGKWIPLAPVRWLLTFAYTTASWLFFLERDTSLLWQKAISLIRPAGYSLSKLHQTTQIFAGPSDLTVTCLVFGVAMVALAIEGVGVRRNLEPYHFGRRPAVGVVLVFLIVLLAPLEESSFIYFNF